MRINQQYVVEYFINNNDCMNKSKKYALHFLIFLFSAFLCVSANAIISPVSFPLMQRHAESTDAANRVKVDIFYYRDFPYRQHNANQQTEDCIQLPESGIIRCKELVSLLRPEGIVRHWLSIQKKKGYLPLKTLKEFSAVKTKAYIDKVAPIVFPEVNVTDKSTDSVKSPYALTTGLFIKHVLQVRQYAFKNIKTTTVFFVTATPDHPVYSVNRHAFTAISTLSPEDSLLSSTGDKIQLLCPQSIKNDCGAVVNKGQITRVYNIKTGLKHTYFVQNEQLLVHNCGGEDKAKRAVFVRSDDESQQVDAPKNKWGYRLQKNKVRRVVVRDKEQENILVHSDETSIADASSSKIKAEGYEDLLAKLEGQFGLYHIVGFMDYQGHIGAYSELEQLSLNNGRLIKKSVTGETAPVTDTLDSFDFKRELTIHQEVLRRRWKDIAR